MSVQAPAAPVDRSRADVALPACGTGRRVLAHAIDLAVVIALAAAVYLPTSSVLLAVVVGLEAALGLAVWEARSGRTIGKHLLGIRAAQARSDYAPGLGRGMVRSALLGLSHGVALVGQFLLIATAAFDRTGRGRAWHDRLAGTRVVSIRADAHLRAPRPHYAPGAAQQPYPGAVPYGGTPGPGQPPAHHPPGYPAAVPARPGSAGPVAGPAAPPAPPRTQVPLDSGYGRSPAVPHPPHSPAQGHQPTGGPAQRPHPGQPAGGVVAHPGPVVPGPHPGQGTHRSQVPGPHPGPGLHQSQVPGPAHPPAAPATGGAQQQRRPGQAPAEPAPHHGAPQAPGPASSSAPTPPAVTEHTFDPAKQPPPPDPRTPDPRTLDAAALGDLEDLREGAVDNAVYVLTIDDGTSVTVSGNGLIGRRPQAGAAEQVAHLVAVDDPGRSLSRTHAAFGIDGETLWVEDRGSANGTVVVSPDGTMMRVHPGTRIPVPTDGRIELGERAITAERWQA